MPAVAAQSFVAGLHESGRRFVPILDPGIPLLPGYAPYEDGIKRKIFLRDVTGSPYIGEVRVILLARVQGASCTGF